MNNYNQDANYEIWKERIVIAECLRTLGLTTLASQIHTEPNNGDIIDSYIQLLQEVAEKTNDNDVIDRLCFAGLIYG
jgi:hypothetical protein